MTLWRPPLRPRPRSRPGAFFVRALLAAVAVSAAPGLLPAQVPDTIPPLPDTIPAVPFDTIPMPPDTLAQDTLPPEPPPDPPRLPPLPAVGPTGWAAGVWEWERADLLRLPDLSLLHLLERIPGITAVRVTSVGQPEAAAVFGATAAAIRYEVDGFVLDPLSAPTFDPSRFPLVALESVRVERRVTGATVRIRTLTPVEPQAHSIVEAATGDLRTNIFRGTFLAPHVLGGGLALGFESLGSQALVGGTSNHLAGWLKWTWQREESGLQLEYRQSDMTRDGVGPGLEGARRDWVVRARSRLGPITAEGYAGASSVQDDLGDLVLREGSPQGGLRFHTEVAGPLPVEGTAAVRLRGHPRLPAQELDLAAWAYPAPWLAVGGELAHSRWDARSPTGRWSASARAGPVVGLTVTAGVFRATDLLPMTTMDAGAAETDVGGIDLVRDGARAGLEFQRGGWLIAAAAVRTDAEPVPGFGLAFDATAAAFEGGRSEGVEAVVRVPTWWRALRLEGWYVGMDVPAAWPYLPAEQWSAALVYHGLPLPSGNLEIYGRAEHMVRGAMAALQAGDLTPVGAYRATNLELTVRVLTVRAFVRWQNMLNRPFQQDVPGFSRPPQHVIYGVKWEFRN